MKNKLTFYTEISYIFGIIFLAFGTVFMEKADFGMSMVVAPAYILHIKISQYLPFFTFGTATYVFQAALLVLMIIILRKFKVSYLFSFVTAVLYGAALDGAVLMMQYVTVSGAVMRIAFYIIGMVLCSTGVAFYFHTYIAPEVFELFVMEISKKYDISLSKLKITYDVFSCLLGIILSFCFFGLWHFEGIKWGTAVCAVLNGVLIGIIGKGLESVFEFKDGLKLRKYF